MSHQGDEGRSAEGYSAMPQEDSGRKKPVTTLPKPLETAVRLMWLGAALSLAVVIYNAFDTSRFRDTIEKSNAKKTGSQHLSASAVDTAVYVAIAVAVVVGLLSVALWVFMAIMNRQGRGWARIVATVLFGLSALGLVSTVTSSALRGGGSIGVVSSVLTFLIGLAVVILIWRKESSTYYQRNDNAQFT